jgi:hypothetical protein
LVPASSQTSASSKRWRPPSQRPSRLSVTHFADWSIVIVVYRLREPVARQNATLNGKVSALVVACVPRKSAIESGPCSAAIALRRSPTSRVASRIGTSSSPRRAVRKRSGRACSAPKRRPFTHV